MKNKVEYVNDTFDEYLNKSDFVSTSDLKLFLKSPRLYFYEKNRTDLKNQQRHFAIGSALQEFIMEQEKFYQNFVVSPKFDRRTKDGKQKYDSFQLEAKGKTIINEHEMTMIIQMSIKAKQNRSLIKLLEDSQYEISCYTLDKKTGLNVKLRPDILPTTENTILGLKSCFNCSRSAFMQDAISFEYSLSSAYYLDFLDRKNYIFVALEQNPPYQASLYSLNDKMIESGRQQYRMGLDLLKWSLDNNYWCDYLEFETLKQNYLTGDVSNLVETIENSELINIL